MSIVAEILFQKGILVKCEPPIFTNDDLYFFMQQVNRRDRVYMFRDMIWKIEILGIVTKIIVCSIDDIVSKTYPIVPTNHRPAIRKSEELRKNGGLKRNASYKQLKSTVNESSYDDCSFVDVNSSSNKPTLVKKDYYRDNKNDHGSGIIKYAFMVYDFASKYIESLGTQ